ncbi:MAG: DUF2851 family protein [Bacteroidales bacterium]
MTEEFLSYLWKFSLYDKNIPLSSGESFHVINPGSINTDADPDFFLAKIRIGETLWAGNIEIHVKSSDWIRHEHQKDDAYDNIILHVVYENDISIKRKDGKEIPVFELKDHFPEALYAKYLDFITNLNWIPCEKVLYQVNRFVINNWIDRVLVERLEHKAAEIEKQYACNGNNWEETFYQFLCRNFGFKVNSVPFELLAKSLPLKYLGRHKENKLQIEAMLFGQAGLLSGKFNDEYPEKLLKEYQFLSKKYNLKPIDIHLWRLLRLRPVNFPTIRLAQFADLVFKSSHLFSKILQTETLDQLTADFNVGVSEYWQAHYIFDKPSAKKKKELGKSAINLIIINTIIPFLFVYGTTRNNPKIVDRSLKFLDQIPGESNAIISRWKLLGMNVQTAFYTQALIF